MKILLVKILFSIGLVFSCSPQSSPLINDCDSSWSNLKYLIKLAPQNATFYFNDACNGEIAARLQIRQTNETIKYGITNIHLDKSASFLMGFRFNLNRTSFKFGNLSPLLWKFQSYKMKI
jgi:hypothetical protein